MAHEPGASVRGVRLCASALLRRRWPGLVAVALLVGLGGGAVLAAAAGARRTDTAASRLYRAGGVADAEISPVSQAPGGPGLDLARLARIPQVKRVASAGFYALGARQGSGPWEWRTVVAAEPTGQWIYRFDRIGRVPGFRGRMPAPQQADDVVASLEEARQLHLHVGSVLHLAVGKPGGGDAEFGAWLPIRLRVVGIAQPPVALLGGAGASNSAFLFGTPAFARRFGDRSLGTTTYVVLRRPGQLAAFEREFDTQTEGTAYEIKPASNDLSTFARVATPYTDTLWIFALVAGIATALIVAQALVRMVRADADSAPELRALGVSARARATIAGVRAGLAVLGGLALAVVVAIAASPLFPLGLVRRVEPEPGVRIDLPVLALGVLALGACLILAIGLAARGSSRPAPADAAARGARPSRAASALDRANAPVGIVGGTRFAFAGGGGGGGTSTASAIFGLVAAIAALSAALVFGANLDLLTTPRHYGQTWDAEIVWQGTSVLSPSSARQQLVQRPLERGATLGTFGDVKIGERNVEAFGLERTFGDAMPVATKGRMPVRADEIALGARTMRELHTTVGATLGAHAVNGARVPLRVVGQTLLPSINVNAPTLGADDGAVFTRAGLARIVPGLRDEVDFALVDLAPHVTLSRLGRAMSTDDTVTGATAPGYIASYGNVRSTPLVLAGLLTALGIGVLVHLLVTSVRARRRDLGVLKTLGCTRGQLLTMVIWQALLLVLIALSVGLTAGVVLGRAAWTHFALGLGLAPLVDVPTAQLAVVAVVGLACAALIASIPARAATQVRPARALRAE